MTVEEKEVAVKETDVAVEDSLQDTEGGGESR